MPKQLHFDRATKAKLIFKKFSNRSACAKGVSWCNGFKNKSFGELADAITASDFDQTWAAWFLVLFGADTSLDIRKQVIDKISEPSLAFNMYKRLFWLTDAEDDLLIPKFRGKLPVMENELATGIIKRAKV